MIELNVSFFVTLILYAVASYIVWRIVAGCAKAFLYCKSERLAQVHNDNPSVYITIVEISNILVYLVHDATNKFICQGLSADEVHFELQRVFSNKKTVSIITGKDTAITLPILSKVKKETEPKIEAQLN